MWRRSPWPTRPQELFGQCWLMIAIINQAMQPREIDLTDNKAVRASRKLTGGFKFMQRAQTRHCKGESHHRLRRQSLIDGKQVRPWLAKPAPDEAPRVRVTDRGADQLNPSGTAALSCSKSPNVRVQSLPQCQKSLKASQTGGVHVRPVSTVWRSYFLVDRYNL